MCEAYRTDAEVKALSSEREAVIMKTVVLEGTLGPAYATYPFAPPEVHR